MTMLTSSQAATELFGSDDQAQLKLHRLLSKALLAHYPQSDGSTMVSSEQLDHFYQRGQPDKQPPRIKGGWFVNSDVLDPAQGFKNAAHDALQAMLPDQSPKQAVDNAGRSNQVNVHVEPTGPLAKAFKQKIPASRAGLNDRDAALRAELAFHSDAAIIRNLREAARTTITEQSQTPNPIEALYSGRDNFKRIMDKTMAMVSAEVLVSESKRYENAGRNGTPLTVKFAVLTEKAVELQHLQRLANLAF